MKGNTQEHQKGPGAEQQILKEGKLAYHASD